MHKAETYPQIHFPHITDQLLEKLQQSLGK